MEVNAVMPAVPKYMLWSDQEISWSFKDHPKIMPNPGGYALVLDPIMQGPNARVKFSKVLIDNGSSINIMYRHTMNMLGITENMLQPTRTTFHGIVPGLSCAPVGKVRVDVSFGGRDNCRVENLEFEVVDLDSPYHALLGRPALAAFMASTHTAYLKMKMPAPRGPLTVVGNYKVSLETASAGSNLAESLVIAEEKRRMQTAVALAQSSQLSLAAMSANLGTPAFKPTKETKDIVLDPAYPERTVRIGVPRELAEHSLNVRKDAKPVRQPLRRFAEDRRKIIGEEVTKLLVAGFIVEVLHTEWLANPVLVEKKKEENMEAKAPKVWRMCIDYTNLNKACPKDPFPLPRIDQVIDSTAGSAGGTFMSITLGEATKLLDNMMINYSEWHTERAPQGKKVNSVEETSSLSDKIDAIMSMLVNDRTNIDPNNVPLASLVAQEEHVDVNFIKNNNFNNNAYRNNSSNNYRPYPYNNGNGYGNSYGNSYNNNRSSPPGLEAMLKEFISTQTAFNKSVEEKLGKIDMLASKVDSLAADVDLLKSKVMPNENHHNKIVTTANSIQVRINENIRLMAELRARWDREENEKLAKEKNVAKVWTITTTSNANSTHVAAPPTNTNKRIDVSNVSTSNAKREKLPETAKTAETACDKAAEIFSNIGDDDPIALDYNGLNFDDCHISEVIKFLQKLAKSPNASAINLAFTHHITNALIKAREEKLEREASIPKKLEDGWEPIIKMKVKDFDCNALCDLGASISVMPKKIYNMLDLPPLKNCYLDVNLADHSTKKPLGKVDNVRITVNNNLVPVDFVVLDIECNASCPIILGRPFLRTVGAIIDMKEGNIKYQFPLKKGMEHFPRKRMKVPFDSIMRTNYDVDTSSLDNT
ncbi:hypothetical protein QYE76_060033 [Lolium multiflorum]|uniref:Uncharacterized protein n=1 Tax=Lolium multiflorum TaxID=4521 RepID=A0AAD8W3V9_LOLMU|nr:hypothetical protein QYE76_060033 [Lolium multiflorum]